MAGNKRKDLVLQWKNLFHLLPPLKLQQQSKKRDGGSSTGSSSVFLSQGTIEPQWVTHSRRALCFSSGVRENKRPVSVLLVQWFFCLTHTTSWQICSHAFPAAARLAPLPPSQQPYSSMLQGCVSKLSMVQFRGSISSLLLWRCAKAWKRKQICSSWGLLSPDTSHLPS